MNKLIINKSIFEDIKHIDENSDEYWEARKLMVILKYSKWQNFKIVIDKAIIACENSSVDVTNHFTDISKMVSIGSKTIRKLKDYIMEKPLMI